MVVLRLLAREKVSVERDDRQLAALARGGDEAAFAALVRRHQAGVRRCAARILSDDEEARDIAQLAFVRAWENLSKYDAAWAFSTWVYRIALNTLFSYRRSCQTGALPLIEPGEAECIIDESNDVEEIYNRKETQERLARSIAKLSPRESAAITLFYMDGLGYKEIASIMQTSLSGVGLLLHRGRERLHAMLA